MGERLTAVLHSLGFRLFVPLLVTVGVVLALHAMVTFNSMKEHFLGLVTADVDRSSELIKRATRDSMLLYHKEEVQATIKRLAQGPEVSSIRIYDKRGFIAMSATESELGWRIGLESETCLSCHADETARNDAVRMRRTLMHANGGGEVLRHLSVILNEPSCSTAACHAHPTSQRVLGVLDVEMSMAPLEDAVRASKRQFLWTTLALVLIVGVVTTLFVRRLVQRPVVQLSNGLRQIAGGDLETRLEVRGRNEFARLAEVFNGMASDLSNARRELAAWSQKLEDRVSEKTEELGRAQQHVIHMEKMASLGKLAATVAHELNNPLSGMITYARLVRREIADQPIESAMRDELTRYLTLVEKECARCGSIVQNLMHFARRSVTAIAPVDINEVAQQALMLMRHHFEISQVNVHCEPLAGDSIIAADAGLIQQALVALLVNAVEAMKPLEGAGAELTVRLCGNAEQVQIDIADTGVGIPPEVLPQIFEPFFSTKNAENGVGLGLPVVYGILQRHGGRIEVESTVGQGTVFHLWLPRQAKSHEEEDASAAPEGWRPTI